MKTLVESLFDSKTQTTTESLFDKDLAKKDIPVDEESILSYIEQKIKQANKKGVNVEMDRHPSQGMVVAFRSKDIFCPDKKAVESYNMAFVVTPGTRYKQTSEKWLCIKPYKIYGITKGINWHIRRINMYDPGTNRHVETLNIQYYIASDRDCENIKTPEEIYKVIDGYFEIFEKLNEYRLFDGLDEVEDMSQGKLINKVYDKLKKIWPDVPKLMR